jgi:hypothetical protein
MQAIGYYVECRNAQNVLLREGAANLLDLQTGNKMAPAWRRKILRDFHLDDTIWLTLATLGVQSYNLETDDPVGVTFDDVFFKLSQWQFVPTDNLRRALKLLSDQTHILRPMRRDGKHALEYHMTAEALAIVRDMFGKLQSGPIDRFAQHSNADMKVSGSGKHDRAGRLQALQGSADREASKGARAPKVQIRAPSSSPLSVARGTK